MTVLAAETRAGIFASYDQGLWDTSVHGLRLYGIAFSFMALDILACGFFTALNNGLVSSVLAFVRTFAPQVGAVLLLAARLLTWRGPGCS